MVMGPKGSEARWLSPTEAQRTRGEQCGNVKEQEQQQDKFVQLIEIQQYLVLSARAEGLIKGVRQVWKLIGANQSAPP